MTRTHEIETPHGTARIHADVVTDAVGALVLGHGAGGHVEAPDMLAACEVARDLGFTTVRVEQPWRVAGRRAPAPIASCCEAWLAVIEHARAHALRDLPLVVGGRSMGARVACRTAVQVDAVGVLCLAFPLQPAARAGKEPPPSRQGELDAVDVPVLVVQGVRDRFGMPKPRRGSRPREVVQVAADHGMKSDLDAVRAAVRDWLSATSHRLASIQR